MLLSAEERRHIAARNDFYERLPTSLEVLEGQFSNPGSMPLDRPYLSPKIPKFLCVYHILLI